MADIHALCRIFADLFADLLADLGRAELGTAESIAFSFSFSYRELRNAELFIAALFITALRRFPLLGAPLFWTMRSPKSEVSLIFGAAEGSGALDHVVRTGEGCALWRGSRTRYQGYVRVLADQTVESSFMWSIDETINSKKYASTTTT